MTTKTCKIESCKRNVVALGLCSAHYSKLRKYGDPIAGRENKGGECSVDGCSNPVKGLKLCAKHYARLKKHGNPMIAVGERKKRKPYSECKKRTPVITKQKERCYATGCDRVSSKNGLCLKHYNRLRRLGVLETGRPDRLPNLSQIKCHVDGCGKNAMALNMCPNHYRKFRKYGDPLLGGTQDGRSKVWHVRNNGYVIRFELGSPYCGSNGIVYQHRQVMAEVIGRPLRNDENVHHKNGDRSDNRIENLELWSNAQPAGQRVQDKVAWAKEILQLYGDVVDKLL